MRTNLLFLLLSLCLLTACKKDDDPIPVSAVTLSHATLTLAKFEEATLTATVAPENATERTVAWVSSKPTVAFVSAQGVVVGLTAGKANITAAVGGKVASCEVTVEPDVYVAGEERNGTTAIAKLWKNGVVTALTDGTKDAYAQSIFVVE